MAYDLEIGTATVFMEASGESPDAQSAVAHVLVNRMNAGHWGNTIAAVCLAPLQFSSWSTNDPNRKRMALTSDKDPTLMACEDAIAAAVDGKSVDPTGGAEFYYDDSIQPPSWAATMTKTVKIGRLNFYKP